MHRYLWLVAALVLGCGHRAPRGVPSDGGADVTLYGAAFPEQVPLAALTKSGATDGQVPVWSASGQTWAPGTGGGFTAGGDLSGTSTSQEVLTLHSGVWQVSTGGPGLIGAYQSNGAFITQNAPTSDLAAQTFSVAAMPAFAGATVNTTGGELDLIAGAGATTNGTGANVVVKVSAPSGSGTEAGFSVQRSGVAQFFTRKAIGVPFGLNGGAIWLGGANAASPSNSNFTVACDDSGDGYCFFNGPNDGLVFGVAGTSEMFLTSNGSLQMFNNITLDLGGGAGVLSIYKAATNPSATSTGTVLLSEATSGLFATKPPAATAPVVLLAGYATLAPTATQTLSAAQSSAAMLQFTGSTASTVTSALTPAIAKGAFLFIRQADSAAVSFQWSSGSACSLSTGTKSYLVTSDGTNCVILMQGT